MEYLSASHIRRSRGNRAAGVPVLRRSPRWRPTEEWKTEADPDIVPQLQTFNPKRTPGVQPPLTIGNLSPGDIFLHFFDSEVLKLLSTNINKNAVRNLKRGKTFAWSNVTPAEIKKYLGMLIYMAVLKLPKMSDFWRRKTIFHVPFPVTVMSRNRFFTITANLHMSDPAKDEQNEKKKGTEEYDCLHRVRPLLEMMRIRCMSLYHPKQHISVYERMVATPASLAFKQYMKTKLQFFVAADVNGYMVDFKLYAGKSKFATGNELLFDVVSSLINQDFLGSGYIICCDSFDKSQRVPVRRPKAVADYNHYMDGEDTSKQMIGTYSVYRKTRRWYVTAFQHFVDIAVTNSYIIHKEICGSQHLNHLSRQVFHEELCAHLLGVTRKSGPPVSHTQEHFPVPTASGHGTEKSQRASMGRRQCTLCKRSTPWQCEECNVGLCLQLDRNCFLMYHKDHKTPGLL